MVKIFRNSIGALTVNSTLGTNSHQYNGQMLVAARVWTVELNASKDTHSPMSR